MKTVDKIIFNNKEYNKLYKGSDLLFEVKREVELDYLTFIALEPSTIGYTSSSEATAQYSLDKVNWQTANSVPLHLDTGEKVYFKGNIVGDQSINDYAHFTMTGKIAASGSIMSLQSGNPQDNTIKYDFEFYHLFENCSSLTTAPELTAGTLAYNCYGGMFSGCNSLVNAPALNTIALASYCYSHMFEYCSSLVNPPALPADILTIGCYSEMFEGCTSLTKAPDLMATSLETSCYSGMFYDCINLKYIKCNARYYNSYYFNMWVENVSKNGDFYCYDESIFQKGYNGIPDGWTVHSEI